MDILPCQEKLFSLYPTIPKKLVSAVILINKLCDCPLNHAEDLDYHFVNKFTTTSQKVTKFDSFMLRKYMRDYDVILRTYRDYYDNSLTQYSLKKILKKRFGSSDDSVVIEFGSMVKYNCHFMLKKYR